MKKLHSSGCGLPDLKNLSLANLLPRDLADRVRKGEFRTDFYPVCSDRAAWKKVVKGKLQARIASGIPAHAEELLKHGVPELPATAYFDFRRIKNRTNLETPYFLRRTNLGILVSACCITGDFKKYGDPIINYLWAITEERYWCLHAHASYGESDDVCPEDGVTRRKIDLFSAGTASLVALTLHLLQKELTDFSPRVYEILKDEALKKVIIPFLNPGLKSWWMAGGNNWAPWICDNLLLAGGILLKDDPARLAALVKRTARICGRFMDQYPDNGFCAEGPGYWGKAACSLAYWLFRLDKLVPGSVEKVYADPKFTAMMEFPMRVMTVPDYLMSFADGGRCITYNPGLIEIMARKTDSPLVRILASIALTRMQKDFSDPEWCFSAGCGEFLREVLVHLFDMDPHFRAYRVPKLPEKDFMEGHAVNLRSKGFSASLKAGHNMEPHNHNDLGHFTLFFNGKPLIIDLGSEVYSKKTFGPERYTLLCQNALGHNAPAFGDVTQQAGRQYTCTLTETSSRSFLADLTHAYPPEARLKSLTRRLVFGESCCDIEDRAEGKIPLPVTLTMFSPAKPQRKGKNIVFASGVVLSAGNSGDFSVEPYLTEDPHLRQSWGADLWRITFRTREKNWNFHFTQTD